jgi:hypothetical protein
MTANGHDEDEDEMPLRAPPRMLTIGDVHGRLSRVEANLDIAIRSVQETSLQMGSLMAAMARIERVVADMRLDVTGHRERLGSMPDLVEEVTQRHVIQTIEHNELETWRARRAWALKVAATVVAGTIMLLVAYLFGHSTK